MLPLGREVPLDGFTEAVRVTGEFSLMLLEDALSVVAVLITADLTVMVIAAELDALKVEDPAYEAVTSSLPTGRADVVKLAAPATSWAVPRTAPPFVKVTVPPGRVVPLAGLTVAMIVTGVPCATVAAETVRDVVVLTEDGGGALTVTVTTLELDALKATAPEYAAEMESVPVGSDDVEIDAMPAFSAADPSVVAPL